MPMDRIQIKNLLYLQRSVMEDYDVSIGGCEIRVITHNDSIMRGAHGNIHSTPGPVETDRILLIEPRDPHILSMKENIVRMRLMRFQIGLPVILFRGKSFPRIAPQDIPDSKQISLTVHFSHHIQTGN